MADQHAQLIWAENDVPVATLFDDPYFNLSDGLAETRHVFLAGNNLPARFRDGFHIAELGFGTGLNFLAALEAFRASGIRGKLRYTSFEAFPMTADDQARALARYGELPLDALQGAPDVDFTLVHGDARDTLPCWSGQADAWFLDGFSPAKNPELWEASLLAEVARHTVAQGSFATYTAAGIVRRALENAGFDVARTTGYGRKRHMTRGVLR